jgi:hypothetical protein
MTIWDVYSVDKVLKKYDKLHILTLLKTLLFLSLFS